MGVELPKHILIIDDSPSVIAAMREVLEGHGHRVSTASSLREVEVQTHRSGDTFDLLLVDVQMPELDGDEIVLMLQTMHKFEAPIYLLSGLNSDELSRRAKAVEAAGYISKSAGLEEMVRQAEEALRSGGQGM